MRMRLALLSSALLAVSASVALAQDPSGPPGGGMGTRGPGRYIQALLNGITLTPQQQATVDSIQAVYTPQMRALFTPGSPPDSTGRARMAALRSTENAAIRGVLTPEQQKVFDKNVAEMPPMGAGRRGPPGGP